MSLLSILSMFLNWRGVSCFPEPRSRLELFYPKACAWLCRAEDRLTTLSFGNMFWCAGSPGMFTCDEGWNLFLLLSVMELLFKRSTWCCW